MRRKLHDIDLVTVAHHQRPLREFLEKRGYERKTITGLSRDIYYNGQLTLDVFFGKIAMCHTIHLEDRLELDYPTISLADILLQKLQIVRIDERDIDDITVLILEHSLAEEEDRENIDVNYIARLLSNDWGFYYTVRTNLNKINNVAPKKLDDVLSHDEVDFLQSKIENISSRLEREPKSSSWKLRASIGPRKKWYNEVEEQSEKTVSAQKWQEALNKRGT